MDDGVNPQRSLRATHVARTEALVIESASRLFLANGYASTSLAAVAAAAGVAPRTVYVRFGTKAELFKRVVDVAVVGDAEPVAVMDRPWTQPALEAPTLGERIEAWAAVARQIMERVGELFVVAQEAAAVEPALAELVALGRAQSLEADREFWGRARDDGLLDPTLDLDWIVVTASVVDSAETYVRLQRQHGWSLDEYATWLTRTLIALAASGSGLQPASSATRSAAET